MDTLGKRLTWLMENRKIKNADLAKIAGVSHVSIGNWRKDLNDDYKALAMLNIADALGTSVRYLLTGKGPVFTNSDFDPESEVRIPVSTFNFSAGPGAENQWERTGETLTFRREWMQKHRYQSDALVIAKVQGSSMEKTLYDGDAIAINKSMKEPLHDHVYAISFEEHFFVKRLLVDVNRWSFVSDNPDNGRNRDIVLIGDDRNLVNIEGRVVHRMGDGGL